MSDGKDRLPDPWPAALEALAAAPVHHGVLFENDAVRVLDTRIGPGERTPVHTHRWPSVLYALSFSDFVRYDGAGAVMADSRTLVSKLHAGSAVWTPPLPPHSVENVGGGELRVIAVELKKTSD
jgi:quercetin dioxygenase-like cupin family protein